MNGSKDLGGSRLGPYLVESFLGAGGMGEVWKAIDTRLGRAVALKVLAERFAASEEMRQRFEREARTIAQISHPSICAIFDVGSEAGRAYIVMELLEGESLAERLARGALPASQALRIARDVCAALAAAHRKGIVHRDVKPANVFLSASGTKLLDFGLAKLRERVEAGDPSQLVTRDASALTGEGSLLGTLPYMAPEQLEGRPADARADLFAVGSVLFEMVTGKRPFTGETSTAIITQILSSEPPPVSSLRPLVPRALDRAVRTCLAKDPDERWQSAADLGRELAWIESEESGPEEAAPRTAGPRPRAPWPRRLLWLSLGALAGAGAVLLSVRGLPRPPPGPPVVRFTVPVPPGTTYDPMEISRGFAVSPDGTRLVIEAESKAGRRLFLRRLDSDKTLEIEGTDGAGAPFWSPDGRFLAFFAYGKLKKVPAAGGPPEEICASTFDTVGTWSRDGTILFAQIQPAVPAIYRVSDRGGAPVLVTRPEGPPADAGHAWPVFLPDGRRFLYSSLRLDVGGRTGQRSLRIADLDGRPGRTLAPMVSRFEYAGPGYLIFARDAALYAQRFDESKGELRGEPQLLADDVHCFFGPGNAIFSVSDNGVIAYQTAAPASRLVWLERDGREAGPLGPPLPVQGLRISPDGGRVAVAVVERKTGTSDLWVFDAALGVSTRLHSDGVDEKSPVWSADGKSLSYRSDPKGPPDIYRMDVEAPGSERPVLAEDGVQQPEDASRDGRFLVYTDDVRTTSSNIKLLPLAPGGKPVPWLSTRFRQTSPRFSPDGRWIAYESDESGESEIYMALTEGGGEKRRLSLSGGRLPRWRGKGGELTYLAPDGWMMSVPVAPGPQAKTGAAVRLFRTETPIEIYDLTPDGARFLASLPLEKVPESPLRVLVGWQAALSHR